MDFLKEKYLQRLFLLHIIFSFIFLVVVYFLHKHLWILIIITFVFYLGVYYYSKQVLKPLQDINNTIHEIVNRDQFPQLMISKSEGSRNSLTVGAISQLAETIEKQLKVIEETNIVLHGVIENMSNSIILIDHSKRIVLVNQATEKLLGYQKKDMLGKSHIEAGRHTEMSSTIEDCFRTGKNIIKELTLYYPDKKNVQVNFAPMRNDKNQEVIGVVIIFVDITDIRAVETMRREFVANVSHELKTPITSIGGFTETLLDGAFEDKKTLVEFLNIIKAESNRMYRIVNDLLDLTKIEANSIQMNKVNFELKPIVDHIISSLQNKLKSKIINVENQVPDELMVFADREKLSQILINIIDNAIINTPEKGDIIINAKENNNNSISISITDTGIGISKANQKRIFERFYRVDKSRSREIGGTGLGLSIVKHLVEAHNGAIEVNSEIGKGSIFLVTLQSK